MSQSKLAAKCSECGLVGPSRKKAQAEGWVRRSYGGSSKSDWLCPEHGAEHVKERTRLLQEDDTRRRLRTLGMLSRLGIVLR